MGQPAYQYLANVHFKIDREIKAFHDKDKLRQFVTPIQYCRRYSEDTCTQKKKNLTHENTAKNEFHKSKPSK